ncbi:hypothetical protein H6F50_06435 [Coleofasciculus sp. FACHB-712]|uniref:hypothetical protein n=1 Tax=Coleofasciculus sp. FACHB-712 TaxID=2692789 RepID=UPI001689E985|nr:hypothetical protein [Coleofasciculus sp. FACHB-712]MBD1942000.1 hypothetical protein [Coleofasciculus sp. FACHB-712]
MSQIKIDKLTSQKALIPVYRETWKAIAFHRANRPRRSRRSGKSSLNRINEPAPD